MLPEAWIRRRGRTWRFAGFAMANSAFWIWLLVDVTDKPVFLAHNGGLAPFASFFLGVAACSGALAWRMARSGLWIEPDEVVVRGPLRTRRLAPGEVAAVEPSTRPDWYGPRGTPCPTLKLTSGREIAIWALGVNGLAYMNAARSEALRPLCVELNRLLHEVNGPAVVAPS